MINPEKLLGGLLKSGMRRSGGIGGLKTGAVGLGLVGVAMEAFEHYSRKPQASPAPAPPPPPAGPAGRDTAAPPPPPGQPAATPPAPPPGTAAAAKENPEAVLLIRAMIAAAHADGVVDAAERDKILGRLQKTGLTAEEQQFLLHELLSPVDLDTIVDQAASPELARQVYAVSLLAIEVDTAAERNYLRKLAARLNLGPAAVGAVHRELNIADV